MGKARAIPAIAGGVDAEGLRVQVNDRLQRLEDLLGSGGGNGTVPMARERDQPVPLEQVNALIAGLRAEWRAEAAAARGPAAADPGPPGSPVSGQVVLSVPGTLAIESNAAPLVSFKSARQVSEVELLVKQAPVGGDVEVRVVVDGATMATVKLLAGQLAVQAAAAFAIAAGKLVRIDVIAVGITFPGADLSVILRF